MQLASTPRCVRFACCPFRAAGRHLAQLPVDARVGKLLLLGASLGCLAPVLTVAACLSYKSPFSSSYAQQVSALPGLPA